MEQFIRKRGKLNLRSKKVNQYDINGNFIKTWYSMADVQRELDIGTGCISMCCQGKRNMAYGFKWEYF